jgi:hypothetical protein
MVKGRAKQRLLTCCFFRWRGISVREENSRKAPCDQAQVFSKFSSKINLRVFDQVGSN